MPSYYGLYHPHIHFQDKGWLKVAALYWDGLYRMVPGAITPDDDSEVKQLIDSGFIDSRHPGMGSHEIALPFRDLIRTRGEELRRDFGVPPGYEWRRLDHVHSEKMDNALVRDLIDHQLVHVRDGWLGMHPQIANVYMTALAEVMASRVGARPVAESTSDHIAVSGLTVERLSDALLRRGEGLGAVARMNETEIAMASLAISYVVPANPAAIPAKKIIDFRKSYVEERAQFQTEINKLVEGLAHLKNIKDPQDLQRHLQNEYNKKLGPKLVRLKKAMMRVGWDTVDSTTAASFALPQGLAVALGALGFALTGGMAAALGVAFTGWTIWRKHQKAVADALKPSAEAFLYRAERALKPQHIADELLSDSKKFRPYI